MKRPSSASLPAPLSRSSSSTVVSPSRSEQPEGSVGSGAPRAESNWAVEQLQPLVEVARQLGRTLRDEVIAAYERQSSEQLSQVAADGPGDTIYAIDRISETILVEQLGQSAEALGGVVLLAEGLEDETCVLPAGPAQGARWRVLVDPIDGTRGIMYQKRSAWVLIGVAPNHGPGTKLSDIVVAVQVEIPTAKQHLCDELWAMRGHGARMERYNRLTGELQPCSFAPSAAADLAHGYAMITRFFPGVRDVLAAIDEEVMREVLGPPPEGKALCFEDQYASTGGQLYELLVGHDRFNADLRPLMAPVLEQRGLSPSLCCHPYDLCTSLIAEEAGVVLTTPDGHRLDGPLNTVADMAWVGYANQAIRHLVQPVLQRALCRRGLLHDPTAAP